MGLVNQEPALFATTIAGNIMFGKDNADMDQIVEAAKASNAHAFIEGLPDGYQTQVGFLKHSYCSNRKQVIFTKNLVLVYRWEKVELSFQEVRSRGFALQEQY